MKKRNKGPKIKASFSLKPRELGHPVAAKFLLKDNKRLQGEVDALKKSLVQTQDKLETLRAENGQLDKANSLLNYRLSSTLLPELIKVAASTVGTGIGTSLCFVSQPLAGSIVIITSLAIYVSVHFLSLRGEPKNK